MVASPMITLPGGAKPSARAVVLALPVLGLFICSLSRLHANPGSWLPGLRSSKSEHMSGALRALMATHEDDPMVFEEAALLQSRRLDRQAHDLPREPAGARLLEERSQDRYNWVLENEGAGFSARYAHAAVLNTKQEIFVIGGATADISSSGGNGYLNDVWISDDHGRSWAWVTPRTPKFSPRRGHAAVMNANQIVMFVLGGFCGKDCFMNDWWSSENGDVWTQLGGATPWSARHGHAVIMTSKENLILIGGHDGSSYLNDIWSMQDPEQAEGTLWVPVHAQDESDDSVFSPRYGHAVVIDSQDNIMIMGGFYADKKAGKVFCFNDVWFSEDEGRSWSLVVAHAPWTGRYQHTAAHIVTESGLDEVFVIGGLNVDLERCNDVWRSKDNGLTWDEVTPAAPWEARFEHASVNDRNRSLYVIGGMSTGADKFHDVWRSERTCADDVECPGKETVCRDGTTTNFHGLPNPVCVFLCDRKIFDECKSKEACRVKDGKAVCVDPCGELACGNGEVCEVYARGNVLHSVVLDDSEAYCLACGDSRTKFACDKLVQCTWGTTEEACLMRCNAAEDKAKCDSVGDSCKWSDGKCNDA